MSIQKYNGNDNLWDIIQGMQELGLDLESMTSQLFTWFSTDDLSGFIEHLKHEGYTNE